jgi:holo-[acyl-carrier protein] synthase
MIIGIGTDIVDIRRIEKIHARHGARFLGRCFTKAEQALFKGDIAAIARRYAAKEAASKALATGIGEHIGFHDLEILRGANGQPQLHLSETAQAYIKRVFASDRGADRANDPIRAHVSLSDEPPYAVAYVVVEG